MTKQEVAEFNACERNRQVSSVDSRTPGIAHDGQHSTKARIDRLDALERAALLGSDGARARLDAFLALIC